MPSLEGADDSLAALIGVRDVLAADDLRPLYLAWLSALAAWELMDEDEEEYQTCPAPVPADLGELTAHRRELATACPGQHSVRSSDRPRRCGRRPCTSRTRRLHLPRRRPGARACTAEGGLALIGGDSLESAQVSFSGT
ncbi:hypothetical protein [Streptomyces sp. PSKA30]|uniref:hypothetical protein n=1 Tax=Streptomyces sp. PSKA30 TaxID=2874597 RepID=UPI001CD18944|nr:hypothetical protein [Streptomyces sp. PSKA30]MBZ9637974.1 hypothetical protein [Streptomyces sp. PSKA30]